MTTPPMPDFSTKQRFFRYESDKSRIDLGCCSGYWVLPDGRHCISEHTADLFGNIFETYFFSSIGLEDLSVDALFEQVKAGHLHYEHVPDIAYTAAIINDSLGQPCWAVDVCIVSADKLLRKRPPHFLFYSEPRIPIGPIWQIISRYRSAQSAAIPFIMVAGVTGSSSWRDSDTFRMIDIGSEAELKARLKAYPCKLPIEDYTKFNLGVIDARDRHQPFNETVYRVAEDWLAAPLSG